jgi:acetyltransferase-like isoleucine patch superfamily enzyme
MSGSFINILKSLKRKLSSVLKFIVAFMRINWVNTLYFNLKMFPFRIALEFPVYFYGKVRFDSLKGKVIITAPISRGMVKFGYNLEMIRKAIGIGELKIDGDFIINGKFHTGIDSVIIIQKGAVLEIGENSHLGSKTRTVVTNRVSLGRYFRLSQESQIFDSSFHYMLDTENNEVRRLDGTVIMNDFCWVGIRTTIMKNTITPRYTTIASNSLLNKDYTKEIPEKSVIGGIPAKLLRTNMTRIYDFKAEAIISDYFNSNPDELIYKFSPENIALNGF